MVLALAYVSSGCVLLLTPEHGLRSGRGVISEGDLAFLEEGQTTREQVLLRFGAPAATLNGERVLLYHWQVVRGYLAWFLACDRPCGAPPTAGARRIPKDYLILLEFNDDGRLKRFERTSPRWFESVEKHVDRWMPPDSVKLAPSTRGFFLVDYVPSAESQPGNTLAGVPGLRVKIGDFKNGRAGEKADSTLIGHRTAFRHVTEDIYLARQVSDVVRDAITAQWEAAGHTLVENDEDVTLTGRVMEFKIETAFPSSAIGTLDVVVEVRAKDHDTEFTTRRYQSLKVEKPRFGRPSEKHFEAVIAACLKDLVYQMATDVDLTRYVGGKQIGLEIPGVVFEMYHHHWDEFRVRVPSHKGALYVSPGAVRYRETEAARHDFAASCADILRFRTVNRVFWWPGYGRALEIKLKPRTYHLHDAQKEDIERALKEISAACNNQLGR